MSIAYYIKGILRAERRKVARVVRFRVMKAAEALCLPTNRLLDDHISDYSATLDEIIELRNNDSVLMNIKRRIMYALDVKDIDAAREAGVEFTQRSKELKEQEERQQLREQYQQKLNTLEA